MYLVSRLRKEESVTNSVVVLGTRPGWDLHHLLSHSVDLNSCPNSPGGWGLNKVVQNALEGKTMHSGSAIHLFLLGVLYKFGLPVVSSRLASFL